MKKVFLFLTMLLFAFTGTMKAESLTVHDGTTTNGNVPVYGFYADAYNKCEMVYPATELGEMAGGMINSMTFYASESSVSWGANFQVFLAEVENATISAFAGPGTVVYEGQLSIADGEMVVTFDTPYAYAGGNLLVGVYETSTGSYITSYWYGESVTGASGSGYNYNSLADCSFGQKNFLPKVTFDYTVGGGAQTAFSTTPSVLDLGYRPNGAWMAPYVFKMKSNVGAVTVNALDFSGNYFTYNAELPATVSGNNPLEVAVSTGTAEAGEVNSTITVLYSGNNRDAEQLDIKATAYNPVDGDVYEHAVNVTSFPYAGNAPAGIYKNYELPEATEGAEAMYKVVFNNDVMFSAGTAGENAVTAIYPEDFNGQPGPMADNNYVYNGPTINPGPMNMWFSYNYTGSNTFYGPAAGGGFYFGYKIPAAYIAELGLEGCSITTVETAAHDSYPYDLYIYKGGNVPGAGTLVAYEPMDHNPEAYYFFDVDLSTPVLVGPNEDIWVVFYSESPYTAYCAMSPVDATNGKIWYSLDGSSWYSNSSYTPVIYTRFLELPTGREVTVNLADMKIRESKPAAGELAEANGDVMGISKAQMQKANRGNRDVQTLIEEGFEGGIGDWTLNHCHNNTGVTSAYTANTGSYVFRFYYTTAYPQYLISPELSDNNGGIFSFYAAGYDTDYIETFQLGYSTTTNDPSAFTWGSELSLQNEYEYAQYSSVFPAGTKYVAIACTSDDQFYLFIDDILVTAEGGGTPTPPTPTATYQIEDLYVPAGTYYVAVASTTEEFNVDMAVAEVPAPEQAVVISPADGETNVGTPYLAEWVLGDYTEEMQVLVGTQYPPQTVMIDWTDYLVESAFITDLEPNQSYFMQVNERNASGPTYGEIIAFTTPIDPVEGLAVEETNLYPGDAAALTWTANARTLKGYNVYVDGVKWNESLINTNSYDVEGLEYNMAGYNITVTSVYDAGESEPSEAVTVFMTGNGSVSGHAYDKPDEDTDAMPIAFATVMFSGSDEYGVNQTFVVEADAEGAFSGEILAGTYTAYVITEGYDSSITVNATVNYDALTDEIDIYTHEFYYPVGQVTATDEGNDVLVEWSWNPAELIIDFETGDFSQAEFTLPAQYPWEITTTNPYEGTYCMKSTCEGIASGTSSIEVTAEVPYDGLMGFWVRVSSEQNYDKFHFYIDGVEMGAALSGEAPYSYKEYAVTEGTHTYKFEYTKDSSVNSNDDCIYVDNITMYKQAGPAPSGMTYTFDDNTMMGWTSLDADGDGNGWVSSANPGIYHNSGVNLSGTGHDASEAYVISGSYANQTYQALTPDNYLVSPAKIAAQNGAAISFYACAQDASYAAEHFGVAVSTGSNTSAADFTTVQEWTMTAKNGRGAEEYSAVRGTRQGSWYQYTVDLSAYAGQEIWVAIRHFNCTDMFILNVDDITLGDGSEAKAPRNDRTFQSFNVYRRNNVNAASVADPELIVEGTTDFEYTDAAWETLEFGEWQWGIAATYEGYAPVPERSRETATFGFEGGLEGWTGIVVNTDGGEWLHSDNNPGGYDYTELAHTGTGFAVCYSFVDYVGSFDTDAYLVSPQKYSVDASSTISFWADNANDSYPENFSVCVSTAANPTASDFVQIWNGGAKGANVEKAAVRRSDNRYENWRSHEISLAAYAGQEIWIAFHDVNYDQYEIWIDDVTITYAGGAPVPPTPGPTGSGISEIIWSNVIDKDMEATLTFKVSLNNGQSPEGATIAVVGENNTYNATVGETGDVEMVVRKGDTYNITIALEGYTTETTSWIANTNAETFNVTLVEIINNISDLYVSPTGWAMWENATGGVTPPTPPTPGGNESFTEGFEGGLNGWNVLTVNADGGEWLHSSEQPYGHDYSELAHTGTGFAICYSFVDYTGAFDTDSYMYTPQKYNIVDGSTLTFWADNANDSYPENFSVCVATADNPTAADFTQVWSGGAKGTANGGEIVRHQNNRYENWRSHSIDLSAYAGQEVYIAFHDVNYDAYEIWIDDVELGVVNKGNRAPISYKVMLDGTYVGESYYPFYQHDVDGMEEGEVHVTSVAPLYASGMGDWTYYTWTYKPCENFNDVTAFTSTVNEQTVTLNWTLPGGQPVPPTPGEGQWYYYDNGSNDNNIGAGGAFYWAIMFPAGSYTGDYVTKVATYDAGNAGYAFTGTATIYQGGTTAPGTAVGTVNVATTGATPGFVEYEFAEPVNIDDSQNLWVVFYNETSSSYCAAAYMESGAGDVNARWVSLDGSSWMDLATAGISGYGWMLRVYVAEGAKGEVHEISVPTQSCNNAGVLSAMPVRNNRNMWDLVGSFTGTSAGQQGVATDGQYIYTVSWQPVPTGGHTFYQYDLQGNFIEGFEIAGATQIRDLTSDGEYFYGTSGGTQIYCMDFNTRTLVGTINCSGLTSRHISYDPERDGFWSGNWSTLALYSRTGALIQNGPAPTSAYGSAYYKDADGVEHLFLFCQPNSDCKVYDYNITTGTLGTDVVLDFSSTAPGCTGIAGGCFIGTYAGKTCWFGNSQQDPNLIAIYELDAEGPVPPQPVEGVIGAILYRDGEFVDMFDANTTTYTETLEPGDYTYTIRVIYDGEPDVTYYAMSCGDEETVTVEPLSVDENEVINSIYPNPTSSDLHINATAMKHVTVFNTMGQVVFSSDVNTDSYVLNMGQLEAGVYMVKVDAAQGSSVKRIAVVK